MEAHPAAMLPLPFDISNRLLRRAIQNHGRLLDGQKRKESELQWIRLVPCKSMIEHSTYRQLPLPSPADVIKPGEEFPLTSQFPWNCSKKQPIQITRTKQTVSIDASKLVKVLSKTWIRLFDMIEKVRLNLILPVFTIFGAASNMGKALIEI
jgi:hypothetical protein